MRLSGGGIIKKKFVLYDSDEVYIMRLAGYFRNNLRGFEILCFTEKECFMDFASKNTSDVILAAVSPDEEVFFNSRKCLIILSDSSEGQEAELNSIYKFQSAKVILQKVENIIGLRRYENKNLNKTALYIGMYRPYDSRGIETSLEAAKCLSASGKCLLISFEEFSNIKNHIGVPYSGDLSDVIYYFRQGELTEKILDKTVVSFGNIEILMPMANPVDLYSQSTAELKDILACIEDMGRYDYILLDVGAVAGVRLELFEECGIIIAVADEDSEEKVQSLSWFLQNVLMIGTEVSVFGTLEFMLEESENRLFEMVNAYHRGEQL